MTPLTRAVTLPLAHPDSCVVVASATLASTTKMTVRIRVR
jgi:LmbE family N-acetylglucosaminyl deacetylase